MAFYVKYPTKTCRNKKPSAEFLTPPDSSLSSSSGSLSSGNSERKQRSKRKSLRFKGHTTLLVNIPRWKKLKAKKSPVTSGSDSDSVHLRSNNNVTNEVNRNDERYSLFSSCKILYLFPFNQWMKTSVERERCVRVHVNVSAFQPYKVDLFLHFEEFFSSRMITAFHLELFWLQPCPGLEWTSVARSQNLCTLSLTKMSRKAIRTRKFCAIFVAIWRRTLRTGKLDTEIFIYK